MAMRRKSVLATAAKVISERFLDNFLDTIIVVEIFVG